MYATKRYSRRFNIMDDKDGKEYERILNNPLVTILSMKDFKRKSSEYNEEGKLSKQTDDIYVVVQWEEKVLL